MTSRLAHCSPSVSNRIPAQGRQIKQPRQKHEVYICISIWPASSLLCIHGPTSAALPASLQHLPALFAFAATQPGLEDGEFTATFVYLFIYAQTFLFLQHHFYISIFPSPSLFLKVSHPCGPTFQASQPPVFSQQQLSLCTEVRHIGGMSSGLLHSVQVHQSHFTATRNLKIYLFNDFSTTVFCCVGVRIYVFKFKFNFSS